jgi:peptide/nickel transport system permease protein
MSNPTATTQPSKPTSANADANSQLRKDSDLKKTSHSIGYWREVWQRFRKRKLAMLALVYVVLLGIVGFITPLIVGTKPVILRLNGSYYFPALSFIHKSFENSPALTNLKDRIISSNYNPKRLAKKDPNYWAVWPVIYQDPESRVTETNPFNSPENQQGDEPNKRNIFGTTKEGVDVFAAMLYGTSNALLIGFVSTGIAAMIGVVIGSVAGYFGGWVDMFISRLIEIFLCIPSLILIIAIIKLLKEPNIFHVMVVIGLTSWTSIARLTRGEFLKIRNMEYVAAARALGAGPFRIIFRHILPNAMAPILVPITFGIASAILLESSLSFLGIGNEASKARWGYLLNQGKVALTLWWLIVFPGAAIFLSVMAYNLIGEGLQEATDPRLRSR